MYDLLSLLTGFTLAFMISINGGLTQRYGAFPATVIIHVVGVVFALVLCLLQKKKGPGKKRLPGWIYLGGVIGVLTTVANNLSFGFISMTSIVALGLLGQTVTSLAIDCLGLFGMEKRPVTKGALAGLAFSAAGIFVMLDNSVTAAMLAVLFSFGAGISIVLSRTVNARLAREIGALQGSLVNHLAGLPVSVAAALVLAGAFPPAAPAVSLPVWGYLGGALGVVVVMLYNLTVPKVPAFRLTLLTFLGQLFTGIVLDMLLGNRFSDASFLGGILIAAGVLANMLLEKRGLERARRKAASIMDCEQT